MKSDNIIMLYIFSGVTMGLVYALVALGFNVIYNATEVINFAQGEFVMLGALTAYSFNVTFKLPLPAAFLISVIIVSASAVLLQQLFINPGRWARIFLLAGVFAGIVFWVLTGKAMRGRIEIVFWIALCGMALVELAAFSGRVSALAWSMGLLVLICGGGAVYGFLSPIISGICARVFGIPAIGAWVGRITAALIALFCLFKVFTSGKLPKADGGKLTLGILIIIGAACAALYYATGKSLVLTVFLAASAFLGIGVLLFHQDLKPKSQHATVLIIIITIGLSILVKGIASFIWGKDAIPVPAFSGTHKIMFLGAHVKPQDLWIISIAVLTMTAFWLFYRFSLIGKAMRACSMNQNAAQLMGINTRTIVMVSFGLAGATGAVAGIIIAPSMTPRYDMGLSLGLMGFVAAIVGGIGSPTGAIAGGLTVGLIESAGLAFLSGLLNRIFIMLNLPHMPPSAGSALIGSGYKDLVVFLALLAVLYLKPSGILGARETERF